MERFLYSWKRRFCATDDMVVSEVVRWLLRLLGRDEVVSMCLVDRCTDNGLMVLPRRWGGGNVGGLVRFGKEQEDGNKGVLE